jgi:hypothetical protein
MIHRIAPVAATLFLMAVMLVGCSNTKTSFQSNGSEHGSADTGKLIIGQSF